MNGLPSSSSLGPGASPTHIRSALGCPVPNTECVRFSCRLQAVHVAADCAALARRSRPPSPPPAAAGIVRHCLAAVVLRVTSVSSVCSWPPCCTRRGPCPGISCTNWVASVIVSGWRAWRFEVAPVARTPDPVARRRYPRCRKRDRRTRRRSDSRWSSWFGPVVRPASWLGSSNRLPRPFGPGWHKPLEMAASVATVCAPKSVKRFVGCAARSVGCAKNGTSWQSDGLVRAGDRTREAYRA